MADLMQQNHDLTREVNRHRWQHHGEEHKQNSKNERAENDAKGGDHSKGTVTRRVPHLERERWIKWKEPWRRWRTPQGGQIIWMTLFIGLTLPSSRLSLVTPYPPNLKYLPWTHMMECGTFVITLPRSRWPCTSKVFQTKSCAESFLPC